MYTQGMDPFDSDIANQGIQEVTTARGTGRQLVHFFAHPVIDGIASHQQGKAVYVQADFVSIQHLGDRDTIKRLAHDGDKSLYRQQWEAYKAGKSQDVNGTPLNLLFTQNPEIVSNLGVAKVTTIEQLAGLTDTQLQDLGMGARQWSQMAKAYLDSQAGGAEFQKVMGRLETMEAERAADKQRISALEEALAEANSKDKSRKTAA